MKIAFVHPNLGIGGAERLVVDAAVGLQSKGHEITIFTSFHDPAHAFEETINGTLTVKVYGNQIINTIFGKGYIIFAILKAYVLAFVLLVRFSKCYDIIFVDQLSASIPILRLTGAKIVFYGHFPDKLLSTRESLIKRIYRLPIDIIEEWTTKMADSIIVNSKFTKSVFESSFYSKIETKVVYPGIQIEQYTQNETCNEHGLSFIKDEILLSINRFERKKNIELCINSLVYLKDKLPKKHLSLVVAGGYDERVPENVEYLDELCALCTKLHLTHTIWNHDSITDAEVIFVLSFTNQQRTVLLRHAICLLYTPSNEHFGIAPLEAMLSGVPVIAVNNGGPLESILHKRTGFLCESDPIEFGNAISNLLSDEKIRVSMGENGKDWVKSNFSIEVFVSNLEKVLLSTTQSMNFDAQLISLAFYSIICLVPLLVVGQLISNPV